jgi:hypothetical protein
MSVVRIHLPPPTISLLGQTKTEANSESRKGRMVTPDGAATIRPVGAFLQIQIEVLAQQAQATNQRQQCSGVSHQINIPGAGSTPALGTDFIG